MKENVKKVRTPSTRNPPGPRLLAVFLPLMFVRARVCVCVCVLFCAHCKLGGFYIPLM